MSLRFLVTRLFTTLNNPLVRNMMIQQSGASLPAFSALQLQQRFSSDGKKNNKGKKEKKKNCGNPVKKKVKAKKGKGGCTSFKANPCIPGYETPKKKGPIVASACAKLELKRRAQSEKGKVRKNPCDDDDDNKDPCVEHLKQKAKEDKKRAEMAAAREKACEDQLKDK